MGANIPTVKIINNGFPVSANSVDADRLSFRLCGRKKEAIDVKAVNTALQVNPIPMHNNPVFLFIVVIPIFCLCIFK